MKCDELQYERLGDANKTYPASTLVIRKQFVDAAIAELKTEIKRKEAVEQRWFERCMEARAENVRLKRALYKACANWADVVAFEKTEGIGYNNSEAEKWRKMENKCRAKEDEYK